MAGPQILGDGKERAPQRTDHPCPARPQRIESDTRSDQRPPLCIRSFGEHAAHRRRNRPAKSTARAYGIPRLLETQMMTTRMRGGHAASASSG